MTYLVTPDLPLNIGGKSYTLDGSFKTLKAIQHLMKKDILEVIDGMPKTSFDTCASILHTAIEQYGTTPPKVEDIEAWIVKEVGIIDIRNIVQGWMLIITSPDKTKEDEIKKVGEILEGLGMRPLLEKIVFRG